MIEFIVKRNGQQEQFSAAKVNGWGQWASKRLGQSVDWGSVVIDAVNKCPRVCKSIDLQKALIDVCLQRKSWEYNKMAGRLYASLIDREVYDGKVPTVKQVHQNLIDANIMTVLDYSDDEYADVEKMIDHQINYTYPHYQLNQIRFKYALRNKVEKKEYETAQFVYMRMAMALAENESKDVRMQHVKNYYEHFAYGRINVPTPYYVNLGTRLRGYASCFPAGTKIDILGGQVEIENAKVGDQVITAKSRLKKIAYNTERDYSGDMYTFRTPIIYGDVESTDNHEYRVMRKGSTVLEWVQAKDIQKGDYIFNPILPSVNESVTVWDVVSDVATAAGYSLRDGYIGKINVYNDEFSEKKGSIKNCELKNNADFYRLVGYFFAEGYVGRDKRSGRENTASLQFTFNSKETEYISDVENIIGNIFGCSVFVADNTDKDSTVRISCNSFILGQLFLKLCGRVGIEKRDVTQFFITSDRSALMHLLAGYIRGDGCAVKTGYMTSSVSRTLTNLIRDAALKCGYLPNVRAHMPSNSAGTYANAKMAYSCRITLQPTDELVILTNKNVHKIEHRGTRGVRIFTKFVDGGVVSAVKHINTRQYSGKVYDIGVEDDVSFTIDGMCVHNCCLYTTDDTAKSLAAGDHIAYMMTCASAGIGTHIKTRSLGDAVRGGVIQHQGKLPYYRAMVGAIGANLQNGRGGASTVHYTAFDPEVEVIQKLRHPTTPQSKRIAGCHYSFGSNRTFGRLVSTNGEYAPFSYAEQPELYEAQYLKDQSIFDKLYVEYAKTAKFKLNARDIALGALQQAYETGVQYLHFTDAMNKHTPFKEKIYQSNLCQEIFIVTKPFSSVEELYKAVYEEGDGEIGLCSLAGIVAANIQSDEQYANAAYYCLKMIDFALENAEYPFPNLKHTAQARRNAGVGLIGVAHWMAKNNHKYDTVDGRNAIHELFESHYYHLTKASLQLAKELGVADWMHKTMWPDGWLPIDTYDKKIDTLVTVENKRDWESLRQEIIANGGVRNSVLVAHMPSESSSISSGTTNGVYPIRELYIMKTNDTQVNHWAAPDGTKLKNKYQSAWDITASDMIKAYAVMQKWTDQGISADLYVKLQGDTKVSSSQILQDYLDMMKYSLKSRYYVNSNTSSGKSVLESISNVLENIDSLYDDNVSLSSDQEYCESCTL